MFQWATEQLDKLSQTVAPPPTDPAGRFAFAVQRQEEDVAMGCIAEIDPSRTVVVPAKGAYPIHLACQYSMVRLTRLLMNQPGVSIEQTDGSGNTALHYACMGTSRSATLELVKLLLTEYSADVCTKNFQGQTPYDVATLNSVRQHLLPIQLQKETQFALDNGGQGLPPGIDLGGLRIKNSAMPPPPTFGGGDAAAVPYDTTMTPSQSRYAAIPMPNFAPSQHTPAIHQPPAVSQVTATPLHSHAYPYHHGSTNQHPLPVGATPTVGLVAPAPASMPVPPTPVRGPMSSTARTSSTTSIDSTKSESGYSRVGGSSAAIFSKYRADGFHSSSSDVSLQKKYGHVGTSVGTAAAVPPPPSSGNSSVGLAPVSGGGMAGTPGHNPYHRSVSSGSIGGGYRPTSGFGYRSTGIAGSTAAAAPASGPAYPMMGTMNNPAMAAMTSPPAYFVPQVATGTGISIVPTAATTPAINAPTTPYMPPPPYQTTNYASSFSAAAATTTMPSPTTPSDVAATFSSPVGVSMDTSVTPSASKTVPGVSPFDTPQPSGGRPATTTVVEATSLFDSPPVVNDTPVTDAIPISATTTDQEQDEKPVQSIGGLRGPTASTGTENGPVVEPNSNDDWQEVPDPSSGRSYYYNIKTGETTWDKPVGGTTTEETAQVETNDNNDWVEVPDPTSGSIYYYNQRTNETSWEKPQYMQQNNVGGASNIQGDSTATVVTTPAESHQTQSTETTTGITDTSVIAENDWVEVTDPSSGRIYYYNSKTEETSWEKPAMESSLPLDAGAMENSDEADAASTSADPPLQLAEDETTKEETAGSSSAAKGVELLTDTPEDEIATDQTSADVFTPVATTTETSGEEAAEVLPTLPEGESHDAVAEPSQESNMTQPSGEQIIETTIERQSLPDGWVEATAEDSGATYFYNPGTGEVSWDRPTGASKVVEENSKTIATAANEKAVASDSDIAVSTDGGDDWVETTDASTGQIYYYNPKTGVTSWEKPATAGHAQQPPSSEEIGDWTEVVDPTSGQIYYYNAKTGETAWEKPAIAMDSAEAVQEATTDTTNSNAGDVDPVPAAEDVSEGPAVAMSPSTGGGLHVFDRTKSAEELFGDSPPGDASTTTTNGTMKSSNDFSSTAAAIFGSPTTPAEISSSEMPVGSSSAEDVFGSPPSPTGGSTTLASSTGSAASTAGSGSAETRAESAPVEIAPAEAGKTSAGEEVSEPLTANLKANTIHTGGDGEMMDVPLSPDPVRQEPTNDDSEASRLAHAQSHPIASTLSSTKISPRLFFDAPHVKSPATDSPAASPAGASDLFAAIGLPPPPFQSKR